VSPCACARVSESFARGQPRESPPIVSVWSGRMDESSALRAHARLAEQFGEVWFDDEQFRAFAELTVTVLEGLGIALLVLGVATALVLGAIDVVRREPDAFGHLRRRLGKAILLSLEVLIAGDIVRTVAVDPSVESVGVLAFIVLVRTALSFVLELEISGRWPWQSRESHSATSGTDDGAARSG